MSFDITDRCFLDSTNVTLADDNWQDNFEASTGDYVFEQYGGSTSNSICEIVQYEIVSVNGASNNGRYTVEGQDGKIKLTLTEAAAEDTD